MTSKAFKDFVKKTASDDSLKEELRGLTDAEGKVTMEKVIGLAAEHGYELSIEDISNELDDDQLDTVGGGAGYLKLGDIAGESKLSTGFIKIDPIGSALYFKW